MFNISWYRFSPWYNPIIQTDNQWLIRAAWGKRRVSSKAIKGTPTYPGDVAASLLMWVSWTRYAFLRKETYVIIDGGAEGGHGERYMEDMRAKAEDNRIAEVKAEMGLRLAGLQHERQEARAAKDFARADALRDEIEMAGFVVADEAINLLDVKKV
jgi:hypothetical protein